MTGRERLIAALNRKPVDRLPWSLCMDRYYTDSLPAQGKPMDLLTTLRYFENDIMERHVPVFKNVMQGVDIRTQDNHGHRCTVYETPVGSIEEHYTQTGQTWYLSKPMLCTIHDVKVYQWIVEHSRYEPTYEVFVDRDKLVGEDGLATPSGPLTPIQQLLQHMMRIENTVYLLEDHPDEIMDLANAIHEHNLDAYRIMADSPAEVVFTYEDTSTTVMSRDMYQNLSAPQLDEYADILHAGDKVFIVHMCGKLKGFSDEVGAGRMDGIDSLCPPTTGDFWAHEARACWGPQKIIIGGLEPPFLQRATVEQTVRYTVDVINCMAPGDGFILSSGDAVSYGTPIANLEAVTALVMRYGTLPLDGKINVDEALTIIRGR